MHIKFNFYGTPCAFHGDDITKVMASSKKNMCHFKFHGNGFTQDIRLYLMKKTRENSIQNIKTNGVLRECLWELD